MNPPGSFTDDHQPGDVDPDDDLPVSIARPWAADKHRQLAHYIEATSYARAKWPKRSYVDLYSGPGRQRVEPADYINGSPLVAWAASAIKGVPFTRVLIADAHPDYVDAAEQRLRILGAPVASFGGDAVAGAKWAAAHMESTELHLVFADPYNLRSMPWEVFKPLVGFPAIDFIIHFSQNDLARHLDMYFAQEQSVLDAFAPGWRKRVADMRDPVQMRGLFFEHWCSLFRDKGFKVAQRTPVVRNLGNVPLYRLVFFTRKDFPKNIWDKLDRPQQSAFNL